MSTATMTPPTSGSDIEATGGVLIQGTTWQDYTALLNIVGDRPIRVTYDRGSLEIRMPSFGHEGDAHQLGRMVDCIALELEIPMVPGGATTHRREDLDRGTEPDRSFWLWDNALRVSGKRKLDLEVDPPPDLIVEVDVTSSAVPRLPIFAALGVPELWHVTKGGLHFLHLQEDGAYEPRPTSRAFPFLHIDDASRLLGEARVSPGVAWLRELRDLIRLAQQQAPGA